jgi:tetratricopeptide (TPR) repeat protein
MCIAAISGLLHEDHSAALERLQRTREFLESGTPIRYLNDTVKREFLGGALLSIGIMQTWRQSSASMDIADRIEHFGPMYALNADQLRAVYYSGRGQTARGIQYNQRVETRAIQAGAAWQIVAIGPIGASLSALWNYDALLAKRAAAELERLSRELPTFRHEARHARAAYLVLTGRYPEVIELMRASDQVPKTGGWSRGQGILARAHNRVGEHEQARAVCQAALEGKSQEDLDFVLMNLHLQIEWILAEAALGNFEVARARSDAMLARHTGIGPIAIGALHECRARVALLERDFVLCHEHCEAMRRQFAATDIVSLHELSERFIQRVAVAERGEEAAVASPATLLGDDEHLMTRMRLILTHTEHTFERRAQLGLQIALELTGAQQGFVISCAANGGMVGTTDQVPAPELVSWAISQLQVDTEEQTAVLHPHSILSDTSVLTLGELRYCVSPLGAVDSATHAPFALVLGFQGRVPRSPSAEVLGMLARHLVEQQA